MGISFEGNENFVHNQEPIVTYGGFIEFKKGDKVVGKVDADFDFRGLPEEYHSMALNLIMQRGMSLHLPKHDPVVKHTDTIKSQERKKWFGLF